jgi:hypothetical protein
MTEKNLKGNPERQDPTKTEWLAYRHIPIFFSRPTGGGLGEKKW